MAKQKSNATNKGNEKDKKLQTKKQESHNEGVGRCGRIIVKNLSYKCTEEKLTEAFKEFGKITEILLPKHRKNKKIRGYGFIGFNNQLAANKATEALSGKEFMGRTISVEHAMAKEGGTASSQNKPLVNEAKDQSADKGSK